MNDNPASQPRTWEQGWKGHSQAQLERLAGLSLPEKIAWLEEAQRLASQLMKESDAG